MYVHMLAMHDRAAILQAKVYTGLLTRHRDTLVAPTGGSSLLSLA